MLFFLWFVGLALLMEGSGGQQGQAWSLTSACTDPCDVGTALVSEQSVGGHQQVAVQGRRANRVTTWVSFFPNSFPGGCW